MQHFGSVANLVRTSVQDLLPFLSREKAAQLVTSLRLAAVALREERAQLVIDTPLAVAELCAEMRFLSQRIPESHPSQYEATAHQGCFGEPGNLKRSSCSSA